MYAMYKHIYVRARYSERLVKTYLSLSLSIEIFDIGVIKIDWRNTTLTLATYLYISSARQA